MSFTVIRLAVICFCIMVAVSISHLRFSTTSAWRWAVQPCSLDTRLSYSSSIGELMRDNSGQPAPSRPT
jgi:hypothetical protein